MVGNGFTFRSGRVQNKLAKVTRPRKATTFPVCSVYTSLPVPVPPADFATVSVIASR